MFFRSHLLNGLRAGTASAVPKSSENSGVLTPEVHLLVAKSIYEMTSSRFQLEQQVSRKKVVWE
jgi:hypothetical protein